MAGRNDTVKHVTGETFAKEVAESTVPVLVDFYTPSCGPCRVVAPVVAELDKEADGKYAVVKVNGEECPDLCVNFDVQAVPTFIVFKDGVEVARLVGGQNKARLLKALEM